MVNFRMLKKQGYEVVVLTSAPEDQMKEKIQMFAEQPFLCPDKVLEEMREALYLTSRTTAISLNRNNGGVTFLTDGVITGKRVAKDYPVDFVAGCDTVVVLEEEILSKPCDEEDAFQKLRTLSGKTHKVITGCALVKGERVHTFFEETLVEFYPLCDEEILRYIATKEPMDKAGAYGIQGAGSLFVKGIQGDYFNVVGLPVARLMRELKKFGYE